MTAIVSTDSTLALTPVELALPKDYEPVTVPSDTPIFDAMVKQFGDPFAREA